jgi:hypothetical protein
MTIAPSVLPRYVHQYALMSPPAELTSDPTCNQGQALADAHSAFSWGMGADAAETSEFHFTHNFFECSVAADYLVEYPLAALSQKPAAVAFSPLADEDDVSMRTPGWKVHHGLELVIEELVRQTDMWRHAMRDIGVIISPTSRQAKAAKKGTSKNKNKKCLLM